MSASPRGGGSSGGGGGGGGTASSLSLNDPVSVEVSDSPQPLQGVVAHIGPVRFSPDLDWVGVRLTGSSVGSGKNDGSVRGVSYFQDSCAGPSGGVFVRRAAVSRRQLTRLEELRLKRELNTGTKPPPPSSSLSSSAPASATKAASQAAAADDDDRSVGSSASSLSRGQGGMGRPSGLATPASRGINSHPSSTKGKSRRLDEIRHRRAALSSPSPKSGIPSQLSAVDTGGREFAVSAADARTPKKEYREGARDAPGASRTPAKARAGASPGGGGAVAEQQQQEEGKQLLRSEVSSLKDQLADLKSQLTSATTERSALQQALSASESRAHDAEADARRAGESLKESEGKASELEEAMERQKQTAPALLASAPTQIAEGGEEEGREVEAEAGAQPPPASADSMSVSAEVEELRLALSSANSRVGELLEELGSARTSKREVEEFAAQARKEADALRDDLERERDARSAEADAHSLELSQVRSRLTASEREVSARDEQDSARAESAGTHYRERARLQAELAASHRRVEELEDEGVENDTTIEELALDREAMAEEKEGLEDRLEEMKIDLESGQLELEEARAELEKERVGAESASASASSVAGGGGDAADAAAGGGDTAGAADADDVARALSAQNSRLREALLRLREQSAQEKMEISHELRSAEKDAERGKSYEKELDDLRSEKTKLEGEVRELTEMVDQNAAYEGMVEDLSDRIMGLEDDCAALRSTSREMEEAADVAAEMEEVQAEENRQLMRDMEGRDAAIRNLEEAIKMQRRREEEFQQAVGNYRTTVETLRRERSTLLVLQEGSGDERTRVLAQSRRALAHAARHASDAARARRREADAVFDRVNAVVRAHLCDRLEGLLPRGSGTVSGEISAVKGELVTARLAAKAAGALAGVEAALAETVRRGKEAVTESAEEEDGVGGSDEGEEKMAEDCLLLLADEHSQRIGTALHEVEFVCTAVDVASDATRLLLAGQWPDLLPHATSVELGAASIRFFPPLEAALDRELRTLKEEGGLSPHRSKLAELRDLVRDARAAALGAVDGEGELLIPSEWDPPGWEALRIVSRAKFYCLGTAAVLASPLCVDDDSGAETSAKALCAALSDILNKVDRINAEVAKTCRQLAGLNVTDNKHIAEVHEAATEWEQTAKALMESVKSLLSGSEVVVTQISRCETEADEAMRSLTKFASCLRANKINEEEGQNCHLLSPETQDPWKAVTRLVRDVRIVSGDEDELNYITRAHAVEQQLTDAIDNETKLSAANAKIASTEKSLSSRSKEVGLQNARLAELEQLLSHNMNQIATVTKSPTKKSSSSTEEIETLKEENSVLSEGMEFLQSQIDEYEREIKAMKTVNTPIKPGGGRRRLARKGTSFGVDLSQSLSESTGQSISAPKALALEAALFRPALSTARSEASAWKGKSIGNAILSLQPLSVPRPGRSSPNNVESLALASTQLRLAKASFAVADLSPTSKKENDDRHGYGGRLCSRVQLREELRKSAMATSRMEEAVAHAHDTLVGVSSLGSGVGNDAIVKSIRTVGKGDKMLGRVTVPGDETKRAVSLIVNLHELHSLHSYLLQ